MMRFCFTLTNLILAIVLTACGPLDLMGMYKFRDGVSQTTPLQDGVTQTTPLVTGEVLLASGEPAANVSVTAYVSEYQVSAAGTPAKQLKTLTDASGHFKLEGPPIGLNTIEAKASEESKAIRMNVLVAEGARLNLDPMTLQPTGAITGKVTAAGQDSMLGTMVFIPGTHYVAVAGLDGAYTLQHVPVGAYDVAAIKPTYATAVVSGVQVSPQQTVMAPDLVLSLDAPVLESLSQPNGGAGTELVIRGRNFGASKNSVLSVKFGSTQASRFERVSDTEIRVWVPEGRSQAPVTGPVVVISNGVTSNPLPFQVIASLRVSPHYAGLYVGDRRPFAVEARDPLGAVISDPRVSWALASPLAGTLDAVGNFEGSGEGWSEIRVSSGEVEGLAAVAVTAWTMPASSLRLETDSDIVVASVRVLPDATLLLCDWRGNRILRRLPDGTLVTLAGNGLQGSSPDETLATSARLDSPSSAALDAAGHLYFTETYPSRVRMVPAFDTSKFGQSMLAGRLYTLAGTGDRGFNGDGPDATSRRLNTPRTLVLEPDGSIVFVDRGNRRIRRITSNGAIETLVGGGILPFTGLDTAALAFGDSINGYLARDPVGNLIFSAGGSGRAERILMLCRLSGTYFGRPMAAGTVYALGGTDASGFNGDGSALQTKISQPEDLGFLPNGDLVFIDSGGYLVRKLGQDGMIRTLAGRRLPFGGLSASEPTLPAPANTAEIGTGVLAVTRDGGILIQPAESLLNLVELRSR